MAGFSTIVAIMFQAFFGSARWVRKAIMRLFKRADGDAGRRETSS
jgi:hypothetical protein